MRILLTSVAACFLATAAPAQVLDSFYQVNYAANLSAGDSQITIVNDGATGGNICVSVYTYDQQEELISCCTCTVTPNGLQSISVNDSLVSNTLTPGAPTGVVVKLLASSRDGSACNAASFGAAVNGMLAWATTLAPVPSGGFAPTRTAFMPANLSDGQALQMTQYCGFIEAIGSGYGICRGCQNGALAGASKQ